MSRRSRVSSFAATLVVAALAACALPTAHAAPRLFAAKAPSRDDSLCDTATENRHETADSKGGVCSPLALDQTTGCCAEPKTEVSPALCASECSERDCCVSFARSVVCCHESVKKTSAESATTELSPVSRTHPSMWRRWLIQHASDFGGHGEETVRGESHQFPPGQDEYAVEPFQYCKHRCRTNAESTRYENEYQDEKHHCFGSSFVESTGEKETLSPGRDEQKARDEAGDFKLANGDWVELGLAATVARPSDGKLPET